MNFKKLITMITKVKIERYSLEQIGSSSAFNRLSEFEEFYGSADGYGYSSSDSSGS